MTPETARRHNLPGGGERGTVLAPGEPVPSENEEQALTEAAQAVSESASAYTERGFRVDLEYLVATLLLALAGALAVLVGTLTATGLALADARPDFATLAAVGASPSTRRLTAAGYALVIGMLGAVAGVAIGFLPGVLATWPMTVTDFGAPGAPARGPVIDIPWLLLLAMAVVVPLIAAAGAGLTTRSRLVMVRRLGQ
jgi:putative ABC transport system permease protein